MFASASSQGLINVHGAQVTQLADIAVERAQGIPVQRLWGTCEPDESGGENVCANALNKAT